MSTGKCNGIIDLVIEILVLIIYLQMADLLYNIPRSLQLNNSKITSTFN